MFGYNDMNTYTPNPFAVNDMIRMSGAGKMKPEDYGKMRTMDMKPEDWARMRKNRNGRKTIPVDQGFYTDRPRRMVLKGSGMDSDDEMDGAGLFDEVKKGYNKTKSAVKSKTGQKIKGALMEDKAFMKEFNKAKKQLMDYQNGVRKTKPGKAAMIILEKAGVISKIEDEFKGGVNRLKKANRWRDFSDDTLRKGIDTGRYGYEQYRKAVFPVQTELKDAAKKGIKGFTKMFGGAQGGAKRGPSMWIAHVKAFSEANNIPYKEALKAAGPSYAALKAKM